MGKNTDTVKRIIELNNQGKPLEALEFFDPRAVGQFQGSVVGGAYRGREGLMQLLQKFGAVFPGGGVVHVKNILDAGDTIVVEWVATGKLASGKEVETPGAQLFEFRGGKIVSYRAYDDTETLARAAGRL